MSGTSQNSPIASMLVSTKIALQQADNANARKAIFEGLARVLQDDFTLLTGNYPDAPVYGNAIIHNDLTYTVPLLSLTPIEGDEAETFFWQTENRIGTIQEGTTSIFRTLKLEKVGDTYRVALPYTIDALMNAPIALLNQRAVETRGNAQRFGYETQTKQTGSIMRIARGVKAPQHDASYTSIADELQRNFRAW